MAKNAAEQNGKAQTRFAVGKGRRSSLLEDGAGLEAERASSVKLIERRANRSEPGDVDDLDQKLAGQTLNLLPRRPTRLWQRGQFAAKLIHATRVKQHPAFEHVEVHQLAQRAGNFVWSTGKRRPAQGQAPLAQAGSLQGAVRIAAQHLDAE